MSGSSVSLWVTFNAAAPPGGGGGKLGGLCVATISSSFLALALALDFGVFFSFERFLPVFCSSMGTMVAGAEAAVSMLSGGVVKNSSWNEGGDLPLILVRG